MNTVGAATSVAGAYCVHMLTYVHNAVLYVYPVCMYIYICVCVCVCVCMHIVDRNSSVGTATRWGGEGGDFLHLSRTALGAIQPPVQWVPGLFRGLKRPGRGVDHPPPSGAEVEERVELYLYSPLRAFVACYRANFTFTFYLCKYRYMYMCVCVCVLCVCVYVCVYIYIYVYIYIHIHTQGVPGDKVITSGFNSRVDYESRTSYTHGSNSQRFRSNEFLKYSK